MGSPGGSALLPLCLGQGGQQCVREVDLEGLRSSPTSRPQARSESRPGTSGQGGQCPQPQSPSLLLPPLPWDPSPTRGGPGSQAQTPTPAPVPWSGPGALGCSPPLHLVPLAACAPGTFGPRCEEHCACRQGATCHHVTGACLCPPGWRGSQCEEGESSPEASPGQLPRLEGQILLTQGLGRSVPGS